MSAAALSHHPYPDLPTEVPQRVIVAGEKLFEIAVQLLRLERRLIHEAGDCDTATSSEVCNLFCCLYSCAFGDMYYDSDLDLPELPKAEAEAPLYVLAQRTAAA